MNDEKRNKRVRLLVSRLNKERKKQAKQIDILCNDFVIAQKDFIKALKTIGFAADFYEGISGLTDLNELVTASANLIQNQIQDANIVFFLPVNDNLDCRQTSFEMHIFEHPGAPGIDPLASSEIEVEDRRIENFFTAELVNEIGKSNRICLIEDMLGMGLQCSPACLEKISAAALPLSSRNSSVGFILIYRCSRSSQKPLTADELKCLVQVSSGLARSIAACRDFVHIAEPT